MKSRYSKLIILLLMLPFTALIIQETFPATAATASMRLERVVWGTNFNQPGTVEPGDVDTALSISVTNLSNLTLSGIRGTLVMDVSDPFSDYLTGSLNATSQGTSLSTYINVSQFLVFSGEGFSFQFRISIHPDAVTGDYPAELEVDYLHNDAGELVNGTSVILPLNLAIHNRAPTINSYYPTSTSLTVFVNESIDFGIFASDPDNQSLSYLWSLDNTIVSTSESYMLTATEESLGFHVLEARVLDQGNLTDELTWSIDVIIPTETRLELDSGYIYAGYSTAIGVNLSNTVWTGSADITAGVPSGVIIQGENTWNLNNLTQGDVRSLELVLYAPMNAYGSAGALSFTLSYTDYLGNSRVETISKGVIIRGRVQIVVYDKVTHYNSQTGKVSFSANLLNKGTVPALFVNVSLDHLTGLELSLDSSSYIGELEENDPLPFSVGGKMTTPPAEGSTLTFSAVLSWRDDQQVDFTQEITFTLVTEITTTVIPSSNGLNFADLVAGSGFIIVVLAVTAAGLYYIRKKK